MKCDHLKMLKKKIKKCGDKNESQWKSKVL